MIRAYDDNGNVVDLVEWEEKIRADAIDEVIALYECMKPTLATHVLEFGDRLEQLKERRNGK